jgi:hypothetical protein
MNLQKHRANNNLTNTIIIESNMISSSNQDIIMYTSANPSFVKAQKKGKSADGKDYAEAINDV